MWPASGIDGSTRINISTKWERIIMDDEVLKKAKELLKEPDMIIDLYDFSIVWTSTRLEVETLGFSKGELIGRSIMDFFAISEDKKRAKAVEHMIKEHGFMKVDLKTKEGDIMKFDVEFYTAKVKDGFYHMGKKVKCTKVPKAKANI